MTDASIWHALGIDPTDDLVKIRRAYTNRLKAIDMDAEPRRFVALREAYDAARSSLRETHTPISGGDAAAAEDLHQPAAPPPISVMPVGGADRVAIQRLADRILSLLRGTEPTKTIEDELTDLTLRMTAEIDRDTIDHQIAAEEWIVATIAAYLPRSDAMVRPAVASFRWQNRRHGQYRPDRAMVVVDRMRDLTYADQEVLREQARERQHNDEFNQMLESYGSGWTPRIMFSICLLMIAAAFGSVFLLFL